MPGFSACFSFSFHAFAANFERLTVDAPQTAIRSISEAPAGGIAMSHKAEQSTPHRFVDCLRANRELGRQFALRCDKSTFGAVLLPRGRAANTAFIAVPRSDQSLPPK